MQEPREPADKRARVRLAPPEQRVSLIVFFAKLAREDGKRRLAGTVHPFKSQDDLHESGVNRFQVFESFSLLYHAAGVVDAKAVFELSAQYGAAGLGHCGRDTVSKAGVVAVNGERGKSRSGNGGRSIGDQ